MVVAKERMRKEDGGLARHSVECTERIDWENTQILKREHRVRVISCTYCTFTNTISNVRPLIKWTVTLMTSV